MYPTFTITHNPSIPEISIQSTIFTTEGKPLVNIVDWDKHFLYNFVRQLYRIKLNTLPNPVGHKEEGTTACYQAMVSFHLVDDNSIYLKLEFKTVVPKFITTTSSNHTLKQAITAFEKYVEIIYAQARSLAPLIGFFEKAQGERISLPEPMVLK